jgi:hypothetical protein
MDAGIREAIRELRRRLLTAQCEKAEELKAYLRFCDDLNRAEDRLKRRLTKINRKEQRK